MPIPQWLTWVRRLQSIAQAGFIYNHDVYDQERYQQIEAIASEIAAEHTSVDATKIASMYRHEKGYATPKIDVRGVVFNADSEILLVKEVRTQKWTLPGGWAEVWDRPSQAVTREIEEESGYQTEASKVLAIYDREHQGHPAHEFAIWKLYFLCTLIGGNAQISHETSDVGFFAENALPELDEGRTQKHNVLRFFEHHRDATLTTDFD